MTDRTELWDMKWRLMEVTGINHSPSMAPPPSCIPDMCKEITAGCTKITRQAGLRSDQRLPYLTLCVPKTDLCALSDDVISLTCVIYRVCSVFCQIYLYAVLCS
ncbi:Hypothetical predicted protein [Xyrichtys novacula]|uniref:Uncharacterized protein n=1 Tax=Xyrichtys novacula TaxID=13765 RepID=A0AAV1FKE8_XYRNO|nr:Hypothetical predicted protein [Xyrichtys novacula]